MTVLRSQRTYPLSLTGASLNTSIVAAYDWAGDANNSRAGGNGSDHSGHSRNWTAPGTAASVVANIGSVTDMDGRDPSVGRSLTNNFYSVAGATSLGLPTSGGDWSLWLRIRVPSVALADNNSYTFGRIGDSASANKIQLALYDVSSTGGFHFYITDGSSTVFLNWSDSTKTTAGGIVDLHITYSSGSLACYVGGALKKTTSATISFLGTNGGVTYLGNASTAVAVDPVLIDSIYWSRQLSGAEVTSHQADPYSFYTNSGGGDVTPPTLTSPIGTATGSTTATAGATTDEANGTMYAIVSTSGTAPTATQIQAGQSASGAAAAWSGNQAITTTGAKTLSATGLTASTTYYAHVQHKDAAGNNSTVVTSTSFTTSAGSSPKSWANYFYRKSTQNV